jgi:type IV pilus assembly protein PilQ
MKIKIILLQALILGSTSFLYTQQIDSVKRRMPNHIQKTKETSSTENIHSTENLKNTTIETKNDKIDSITDAPVNEKIITSPNISNSENKSYKNAVDTIAQSYSPSVEDTLVLPKGAKDITTLSFKDTDIRDIFRGLSAQHGLNIFFDNSVNRKTTISLMNVQVYNAMKFLCEQNNLLLNFEGGIFKIVPPPPPMVVQPPPKIPFVSYEAFLLSVQLKDDDLEKVILEIQKKTGHNILIISGTSGTITGTLNKIEFDNGFTQLMNNNGFAVQKKNGIYVVSRLDYYVGTQGVSQPQKSGPYWVSVKDSLVTIDVTNAPVDRVLTDILRQLNTDVVFYNSLTGNITVRATNVSLDKALDMILRNTTYTYRISEGLYFVGEKTNKALTVTKLIKLKHLRADKVLDMVPQSISSQAIVKPIKEHNGLVVIASNDVVFQMLEFLDQIDKPIAMVLIEALVVDYDRSRGVDYGVQAGWLGNTDTIGIQRSGSIIPGIDVQANGSWLTREINKAGTVKLFGTDINLTSVKLPSDFYLRVKALETKGLANIKSRPLLATLNGQQATLSVGTTQYYLLKTTTPYRDQNQTLLQESQTFQTIEADIKLEITPYVGGDSLITVEIKPDFRTPVGQFSSNVPPTINRRALSSTVVIKEGETIILGGLVEEIESEERSQVPILGSIPLLGSLFSSTNKRQHKTELIIYVTPHVSYGEQFQNVTFTNEDR